MIFRPATPSDIPQMFEVRTSVKENVLANNDLLNRDIYLEYLTNRGGAWVSEINGHLVGFGIADALDDNIWALYVRPEFEGVGIGGRLHKAMLNWYFGQGKGKAWLTTLPATKAEKFFKDRGWRETWRSPDGEIRLELTAEEWKSKRG